jgi:hypothetical protein
LPVISSFYGITIRMFYDDHPPPHFHAEYAEYKAQIQIATRPGVIGGSLPGRAVRLVAEWASQHHNELLEDWQLCRD